MRSSRAAWVTIASVALTASCGSSNDADPNETPEPGTVDSGARDAAAPRPRPIDGGRVTAPLVGGNGPNAPSPVDLAGEGYVEEEFLLEGEATGYVADGELGIDGVWTRTTSFPRRAPSSAGLPSSIRWAAWPCSA